MGFKELRNYAFQQLSWKGEKRIGPWPVALDALAERGPRSGRLDPERAGGLLGIS